MFDLWGWNINILWTQTIGQAFATFKQVNVPTFLELAGAWLLSWNMGSNKFVFQTWVDTALLCLCAWEQHFFVAGRAMGSTSLELVALILSDGAEDLLASSSFSSLLGTRVSTLDKECCLYFMKKQKMEMVLLLVGWNFALVLSSSSYLL